MMWPFPSWGWLTVGLALIAAVSVGAELIRYHRGSDRPIGSFAVSDKQKVMLESLSHEGRRTAYRMAIATEAAFWLLILSLACALLLG